MFSSSPRNKYPLLELPKLDADGKAVGLVPWADSCVLIRMGKRGVSESIAEEYTAPELHVDSGKVDANESFKTVRASA